MSEQNLFAKQGQVSVREIEQARDELRGVLIVPFAKENAKGIGYDLRASDFVFSLKKGCLERIYQSSEGRFVSISPKDTVLILTYEYVKLDGNLSGFLFSKVTNVSKGLGHISTTIDPNWAGMLLLAINNGSSKRIRLPITHNQGGREYRHGLVTMVLNVMDQSAQDPLQLALVHPAMRLDILDQLVSEPGHLRRNNRYQMLKKLLQELSELERKKQPNEPWLLEAKQNLIDLKYKRSMEERIYLIDKLIWNLPPRYKHVKKTD